ncbi:uncharacterized protein HD556DRAFT_1314460 [Suillus plorans]|uniref:Uncharacterized protein n=1 Tax=Suillus plorans TaxID=116603 RepID=A0A9P7AA25_9AGAM|nr:uncharacterized protein HD556DRAFT_1314460 [Suillus plorans]KAG1785198.1 hypothetical protein HD556DRAFT_1314460 [Suillus plorans]
MPILVHLDQLTSAPGKYAVQNFNNAKKLEHWITPRSFASPDHGVNNNLEKDFRTSITDVFTTGQKLSLSLPEHLIGRLSRNLMIVTFSKPKGVLEHISGILSTTLPNDAVSGELADLVGFDDIKIVAELLAS